jgi:thioredoxin reductase (NADPH)
VVVGGGNSAGQAVVRFSRYAKQVTLLVRGPDLAASMSQYLIDRIAGIPNVEVKTSSQVVGVEADDRLRALVVSSAHGTDRARLPADSLFICIGGTPRTDGAAGLELVTNDAGYLRTGGDVLADLGPDGWSLSRQPLPLETNRPGVFAAGDVRCGSIKRCAAAIGEGAMGVALVHNRLAEVNGD